MLNQTHNRSQGRFIKKTDPIKKVMTINDFNLAEIMDKPITYHDNANANVIHAKLHSEEDLTEGVRDSFEINMSFPHESRPVIRPLDFTDEWKKLKKRLANRNQRTDEEEEFELDVTSMLKDKKIDLKRATYTLISSPLDVPLEAKNSNGGTLPPSINLFPQAKATSPSKMKSAEVDQAASQPESSALPERPHTPSSAQPESSEFVPYYAPTSQDKSTTALRPEAGRISEAEKEELREAASAAGFQQGFQLGEEKGTLAAQDKVMAITHELGLIMENLQGMQKSILTNVQENFMMICQSFIESLLHREFKVNPEAFGDVIERAIADALPEDEFTIHVSPKAFQDLAHWTDEGMKKRLRSEERRVGKEC